MSKTAYVYGREEAEEISKHLLTPGKEGYAFEYANMKHAIRIMREFREKHNLGPKVIIRLKEQVKMRRIDSQTKIYRVSRCPYFGFIYGKFNGLNPATKDPRWGAIELVPFREFDLDREIDAADWIILRLSAYIEGTPLKNEQRGGIIPLWEIVDERQNKVNNVSRMKKISSINSRIEKMSGTELVNLSRLMGYSIQPGDEKRIKPIDLVGYLADKAINDPDEWMRLFSMDNRELHELIYGAFSINIAEMNVDGNISVLGHIIGNNMNDAALTLKNDPSLCELIRRRLETEDTMTAIMERKLSKKEEDRPKKSNADLRKKLEEEEAALKKRLEEDKKANGKDAEDLLNADSGSPMDDEPVDDGSSAPVSEKKPEQPQKPVAPAKPTSSGKPASGKPKQKEQIE